MTKKYLLLLAALLAAPNGKAKSENIQFPENISSGDIIFIKPGEADAAPAIPAKGKISIPDGQKIEFLYDFKYDKDYGFDPKDNYGFNRKSIAKMPNDSVEKLSLLNYRGGIELLESILDEMSKQNKLTAVSLERSSFDAGALSKLSSFRHIKEISFQRCHVESIEKNLGPTSPVENISISDCNTSNAFGNIEKLPALKSLMLADFHLESKDYENIGKLTHLRMLSLRRTGRITSESLKLIANLQSLEELTIRDCVLEKSSLATLDKLKKSIHISIDDSDQITSHPR